MFALSTLKAYHHGDLRAVLLDTTLALVEEVGVEAFSLREVSRRAGVSHTAAYNHFSDKAALVRALVDDAFARFAVALRAGADAGTDPLDALIRSGTAYVVFAHEHRTLFKMMFRPELTGLGELQATGPSFDAYTVLVDTVTKACAAGYVAGDPQLVILAAWSIVHGLAALIVDGPSSAFPSTTPDIERLATRILGVFVQGRDTR